MVFRSEFLQDGLAQLDLDTHMLTCTQSTFGTALIKIDFLASSFPPLECHSASLVTLL